MRQILCSYICSRASYTGNILQFFKKKKKASTRHWSILLQNVKYCPLHLLSCIILYMNVFTVSKVYVVSGKITLLHSFMANQHILVQPSGCKNVAMVPRGTREMHTRTHTNTCPSTKSLVMHGKYFTAEEFSQLRGEYEHDITNYDHFLLFILTFKCNWCLNFPGAKQP